ncbi:MAG: osmotically-inducible protein OsmY [Verrucomicrobiales bacterium]|jgi:osmotically-inducible protein OsmY
MRIALFMLAAYGVLLIGGMTALYYFNLGDVERSFSEATQEAILEKLADSPDLEFDASLIDVSFKAREGMVSGVVASEEAKQAAVKAVEEIRQEGLGVEVAHELKSLAFDLKRRAECQIYLEGEQVYLRGYLPSIALASVQTGVRSARGGAEPLAPVDPEDGSQELAVTEQEDAAPPEWENRILDFVEKFFDGRVRDAELKVVDRKEILLVGDMDSAEEAQAMVDYAKACFPSLSEKLDSQIRVVRISTPPSPVVLQVVDGKVVLEAKVRSTEVKERLFELIRSQAAPGQSFENGIIVSRDAPEILWLDTKPTFFADLLSTIQKAAIEIGPDTVLIRGHATSEEVADQLVIKVQRQFSGHTVVDRIFRPEPAVPPTEEPPND